MQAQKRITEIEAAEQKMTCMTWYLEQSGHLAKESDNDSDKLYNQDKQGPMEVKNKYVSFYFAFPF